jgi:hypothetical protein
MRTGGVGEGVLGVGLLVAGVEPPQPATSAHTTDSTARVAELIYLR